MPDETEFYSIVVIGAMNPRIHTPAWYRYIELIDDNEFEFSVKAPNTMSIVPVSQVQLQGILIACQQDRWEIQTGRVDQFDRMKSMAAKVFDEILIHTPVTVLGFNFNYQKATKAQNVGLHLAYCLSRLPLGLRGDDLLSGELIQRRTADGRTVLVGVKPSTEASKTNLVQVINNYQYSFVSNKIGFFKLSDTLDARFMLDRAEAEQQTLSIVKAFDETAG